MLRFGFMPVLGLLPLLLTAAPHDEVKIEPLRTSIHVGSVKLAVTPLKRSPDGYEADYATKVFPYFFYNENGRLHIAFSDDELARLQRGETVHFKGEASAAGGDKRRVEGRAVPADAQSGRIKVRVFVTAKIELIFNSTYRFTGRP